MALALPVFANFPVSSEPSTVSARWSKWINRFENLIVALDITDTKRKRALLLHYAGEEVDEIFDTLTDTGDEYQTAKDKITEHFKKGQNSDLEELKFRDMKQNDGETIDMYHTRLRQRAVNCEFADVDQEIRRQILRGARSKKLKFYAVEHNKKTLTEVLEHARTLEVSFEHFTYVDKSTPSIDKRHDTVVNAVKHKNSRYKSRTT